MLKNSEIFLRKTLVPTLLALKERGVDTSDKMKIFSNVKDESVIQWVVCADVSDIHSMNDIITFIQDSKKEAGSIVTASVDDSLSLLLDEALTKVPNTIFASLSPDSLANKFFSHFKGSVPSPKKATEKDVRDVQKKAFDFLATLTKDTDAIEEAVNSIIETLYNDPEFLYRDKLTSITAATHLYYVGRGDEFDSKEIDSEVTDDQIATGKKEFIKFI